MNAIFVAMMLLVQTPPESLPTPAPANSPWLEFRGPNGEGHYTGPKLPSAWTVDKNAEWKTPIDGKGWSSPIVVGDQLILTSAKANDRGGQDLHVHALDKRAGKILWNTKVFSKSSGEVGKMHAKNSYASPTAVSDGKLIIVHFGHMGTACLDPLGKILWQTEKYKYDPQHGNGNSPILVDKNVVFSCDGNDQQFLVALDLATGKEVWKTHRNTNARLKFSFATAQLIEHQGQRQIISPASDFVAAYDPANGKELWRVKYPVAGWSVIPRPVYGEGLVFICTGYVTQHVMAIDPSGTGDVTSTHVKWTSRKFAPNTPTPLLVGTELYTISDQGTMSCYDAKTGKVHWAERLRGKAFSASPIYSDGKIYITSEDGIGQVIAADKTKLEILQINDMKEKTFATLVPDNGALYLRTESALFKFVDKK